MEQVSRGLFPGRRVVGEIRRPQPMTDRMRYWSVPAVSVAVVNDGDIEWAEAWGVKSSESGEPVGRDTLFQAGSISKAVAAIGALRLIETGRLSLDEPINDKLTGAQILSFVPNWTPRVTVRQLLDHSAGFNQHGFPGYQRTCAIPRIADVIAGGAPANTGPVRVVFAPGTRFLYSGGGYSVLQQLMIDVTGETFADLLRRLVFEPLGMENSTYEQPLPERLWQQAASGHERGSAVLRGDWYVLPELAAAGLWTTATDLARFGLALQDTIRLDRSHPVLSKETIEAALTASATSSDTWGLGFMLRGSSDGKTFGHSGANTGFIADLRMRFDSGRGIAVMTNSLGGGELMNEVQNAVAAVYDWQGHLPEEAIATWDGDPQLSAIEGVYELPNGPRFEISRNGGSLMLRFDGQDAMTVEKLPSGELWAAAVALQLEVHAEGPVNELVLNQAGTRVTATRQSDE